jgi:hypothetical protein
MQMSKPKVGITAKLSILPFLGPHGEKSPLEGTRRRSEETDLTAVSPRIGGERTFAAVCAEVPYADKADTHDSYINVSFVGRLPSMGNVLPDQIGNPLQIDCNWNDLTGDDVIEPAAYVDVGRYNMVRLADETIPTVLTKDS